LCLTSTRTIRLIRDGEKVGKGLWRWGKREIIYLSLHCYHQNGSCITMGSDESHFNVSVGRDEQSHKALSTNHNLFEDLNGGSFLPLKIRHRWPRFWNKRRICNRIGKAVLPCPCMNREACCLQLGQLTGADENHPSYRKGDYCTP